LEKTILKNLLLNEEYTRRTLPFIKEEYFSDFAEKKIFLTVKSFINEFNVLPTKEALIIEIDKDRNIESSLYDSISQIVDDITTNTEKENITWLIKETESFCQDKSLYNALMEAVKISDDSDKNLSRGSIPEILKNALSVSFEQNIGHDFIENAEERYEFYHRKVSKIPFDISQMNKITDGGLSPKTLNVIMAGPATGKTLAMCHFASTNLMDGKNVLYITNEISEERIAERIEANLMNADMADVKKLPKDLYLKRIQKIKAKTNGQLKIKEYPTSSASVSHFRFLINELKLKKNFVPDIIYVDYLNICASARYKAGTSANSYTIVKAVAEELRGLAQEFNVPVVTATQTNRNGTGTSDPEMTDLSDSMGTAHTADLIIALVISEELDELGQLQIKQIKNRYADATNNKRFVVGLDRAKMRWYDIADPSSKTSTKETSNSFVAPSANNSIKNKPKFKGFNY